MTNKSLYSDYKLSFNMIRSFTTMLGILMGAALFAHSSFLGEGVPSDPIKEEKATQTITKEVGGMIISYVTTKPSCAGGSDGSIEVTVYGSNPPFTYVWGNGVANQSLTGVSAGVYTVVATDDQGDTKTETITLGDNPAMALLMEKTDGVCNMSCDGVAKAIVTGGVGPFVYTWSNGYQGGAVNSPLPLGWIYVTITDANGCTISDGVEILEPDPITFTVTSVVGACGGSSGSATVAASGGTPPYNYVWNYNGVTGPTLAGAPGGTYVVLVTDANGCQKDEFVTIDAGPGLNLQMSVSSALCTGQNNGSATVAVLSGSGSYSYSWNAQPGVNTPTITNLAPSTVVSVTVTDLTSGCQGIATQTISGHTNIDLTPSSVNVDCANNPIGSVSVIASNGTAPYTYAWDINGATVTTQTVPNLPAGSYFVSVTDANGCTANSGVLVDATSNLTADYQASLMNCVNSQVEVNFTDASFDPMSTLSSWQWNITWPGGGSATFTNQNPGQILLPENTTATVQLTVTSAAGCTDVLTEQYQTPGLPNIGLSVSNPAVSCGGGPVPVQITGGQAGYAYSWTPAVGVNQINGATNVTLDPSITQTYTIVANDHGCSKSLDVNLILAPPINLTTGADIMNSCNPNEMLTASSTAAPVDFTWYDGTNVLSNTSTVSVTPSGNTTYTVIATDQYGCTATETQNVSGDALDLSLTPGNTVNECENTPINISFTNNDPTDVVTSTWVANGLTIGDPNAPSTTVIGMNGSYTVFLYAENQNGCKDTIPLMVNYTQGDSLDPLVDLDLCSGLDVGFVLNSGISGVWNFGDGGTSTNNSTTHTYAAPGTYTVTYMPMNATCVGMYEKQITVDTDPLDLTLNPGAISDCENTPINISYTNNNPGDVITATWAGTGLTFGDVNASSTTVNGPMGSYTIYLYATNQDNCKDTLELAVNYTQGDLLDPFADIDLCDGLDVDFEMNSPVTGVWDFGDGATSNDNNTSHIYAVAGTYTVTFTPSNVSCVATYTDMLMVSDEPAVTTDFAHDLQSCEDEAVFNFTDGTTALNTIQSWDWIIDGVSTSTQQNPTLTFDSIGPVSVTLVVTDINGCVDSLNKEIPFHIVSESLDLSQTACIGGDSLELNPVFNPLYDYKWYASPADPGLDSMAKNPIVAPIVNTTYTMVATWGGCEVTKMVDVKAAVAAQLTPQADKDITVCDETPITLSASSANGTVEWSKSPDFTPSTISNTYLIDPPVRFGVYYVRALTTDGCENMDTIKVHNGAIDVTPVQDAAFRCSDNDADIMLSIQNNIMDDMLNYSWDNGLPALATHEVKPSTSTIYTAVVGNDWGCLDTVAFPIDVISLSVTATTSADTICPDQIANLAANATGGNTYTYNWAPSNFILFGEEEPVAMVSPTESTVFTVIVTEENGCTATNSVPVQFQALTCSFPYIFVPSAFTPNGDGENEYFMVRGHNITELLFVVYDRWGEEMYRTTDPSALGWDGRYKTRELTADSYGWYFRVRCDDGQELVDKGNVTLLK